MNTLFTVGHSTQSLESFLGLLQKHGIEAVVDVRSHPHSGRFPWFSRDPLQASLRNLEIQYVFMGKELGARRSEAECYEGRRADYNLIAQAPLFQKGMERLREGCEEYRIALMCAEKDPLDCHRTILVCRHARSFAEVQHILQDGSLESHQKLELRMLRMVGLPEHDLFIPQDELLSQGYNRRGLEIAWAEPEPASA